MRSWSFTVLVLCLAATAALAGPIEVYFAPDGGFSPRNKARFITFPDGRRLPATLTNSLLNMIERTPDGGRIKICLYALGDLETVDALVAAARDRKVHVKLLLDACAEWTAPLRAKVTEVVRKAYQSARAAKQPFDFQVKLIYESAFRDRGRYLRLRDGKMIYGTMHEKFGVFYTKDAAIPYESFAGSSNVSVGSDQVFAENRIYFWDRPSVARQFQEEFARLWNEYGEPVKDLGRCTSEMFVPAYPEPGDVRVVFNGEPITEDKYYRIDEELEKLIRGVRYDGSIDVAMFSFTHRELADALVKYAERNPKAKFRILLDQTMIEGTEDRLGVMGPWFEDEAKRRGLKNFEVRYKWRSNAFGFDEEKKIVDLVHFRSHLLHHKLLIVDGKVLAAGSYNWSASAEERNLENLMIFERQYKGHDDVIDRFQAEFDAIWFSLGGPGAMAKPVGDAPRTVTGPVGRAMRERLIRLLKDDRTLKVRDFIDRARFATTAKIAEGTGVQGGTLDRILRSLVDAGLLCSSEQDGARGWVLTD